MVNKVKQNFLNTSNWKLYLLIAILLRGLFWSYFAHLVHVNVPPDNRIGNYIVKDDYLYFFGPVENFFKVGGYNYLQNVPFTGRLPGYSIVYLLLRCILSPQIAVYFTVGLQFLLSTISVYVLAFTVSIIFESKRFFHITFWLYILAAFPGFFDFFIIAESFSVSSLIFCFYFLTKYLISGEYKTLILSGLFLAWTIFLREFTGLLIVVIPSILGIYFLFMKKEPFFSVVKLLFLFCLPFILADGIWATRNYISTKKIILLTTPEEEAYGKLYAASWETLDN